MKSDELYELTDLDLGRVAGGAGSQMDPDG